MTVAQLFFSRFPQLKYPQIKDTGIYEWLVHESERKQIENRSWTLNVFHIFSNSQISSTPPRGYPVYLSVVGEQNFACCCWTVGIKIPFTEPLTTIIGGPEIFINTGSTINLTCIVKNSPESPFAMYWTHNNEVSRFCKCSHIEIYGSDSICEITFGWMVKRGRVLKGL